jgi:hypothetical protein
VFAAIHNKKLSLKIDERGFIKEAEKFEHNGFTYIVGWALVSGLLIVVLEIESAAF